MDYAALFDAHWQALRDGYPYFELYGVDWDAERHEHRPRAVLAADGTAFAWEMARMLSVLRDPHVSFIPSMQTVAGWSRPEVRAERIGRRLYVVDWGPHRAPEGRDGVPELVAVQGTPIGCATEILAAGPVGTPVRLGLRWADGSESEHELRRPTRRNLPPPKEQFGERWVVSGRVGGIGYLRIKTFSPDRCAAESVSAMVATLRRHLEAMLDTRALILDVQRNGGGRVSASDPFLGHFLQRRRSYRWGNSGGSTRDVVPREPHYAGRVAVLVDERSASGAEWTARILRDAGRATTIGGTTAGAEAGVKKSVAADGSTLAYSRWPMAEPTVTPFQERGVTLDHAIELTIEAVREMGYDEAQEAVRRARLAKALTALGGESEILDAIVRMAAAAEGGETR